jgi:DNA repair protein RecO (recombination protein O)
MPDKLHKSKGIVLRAVKYGETSLIVTIFTELFGVQSYIINGVRSSTKKGSGKANLFQPTAILELVVYYSEIKNLQRIKEFKWACLYKNIFSDVPKNAVALFMVELLTKCLKQPEANADLFNFCEDAFTHLDESNTAVMANFPLFFALHLSSFFGFKPQPPTPPDKSGQALKGSLEGPGNMIFDLKEGHFSNTKPEHQFYLEGKFAEITVELLKVMQPSELEEIKLNHEFRRTLLQAYETYYALHIHDFGTMRTLPVLREVLG